MTTDLTPATFEPGSVYDAFWPTDSTLRTPFKVLRRTARFVILGRLDSGFDVIRVGVKVDSKGGEYALPFGNYTMAPVLRAERKSR